MGHFRWAVLNILEAGQQGQMPGLHLFSQTARNRLLQVARDESVSGNFRAGFYISLWALLCARRVLGSNRRRVLLSYARNIGVADQQKGTTAALHGVGKRWSGAGCPGKDPATHQEPMQLPCTSPPDSPEECVILIRKLCTFLNHNANHLLFWYSGNVTGADPFNEHRLWGL